MTSASGKPSTPAAKNSNQTVPPADPFDWIGRVARFWFNISRFAWDVIGAALLTLSVILVLGWVGVTQGTLLTPLVQLLNRGFGWGSLLVIVFIAGAGLFAMRRRKDQEPPFPLGRLLALEGWAFSLLGLMTIFSGRSLDLADQGGGGGLVGWGLVELVNKIIPEPFSVILFLILFVAFGLSGFDLNRRIALWIETWLALPEETDLPQRPLAQVEVAPSIPVPAPSVPDAAPKADRKRGLADVNAASKPVPSRRRDERLPPLNLLSAEQTNRVDDAHIHTTAALLEKTLAEFGIPARVVGFRVGPTVTQYAVEPGFIEKLGPDGEVVRQKVRVSQISALARDLALRLSAERLRIEAPVPGRSFVGVEVPNPRTTVVRLRPILESEIFQKLSSTLAIALGQDVSGLPVVADLARMPHMLIAGTTGSGKSVCIEALTACLVMNNTPDELRLAMLDPKMVELVRFNGLPHLLGRVETEIERMLGVLRWALAEMDHRYRLLEEARVRDLQSYNQKLERKNQAPLPRIVVLIDELADLMMSAPDQTEQCVVRLAQMARATGIHLVVATQRPSTDVVTGLIKANFPARVSFTVASSIDSRVILDSTGAEALLGRGDMLFLNPELGTPVRSQGVYVNDQEIGKIIEYWKKVWPLDESQAPPWEELLQSDVEDSDKLVEEAIKIVRSSQRASASMLQRRLRIGYPRAANLIEQLEALGVVGPAAGGGREREVLIEPDEDKEDGDSLEDTD